MSILRDYIAYAKNNINPRLSEEAAQSLIHAYVGRCEKSFFAIAYILSSQKTKQENSVLRKEEHGCFVF